MLFIEVLIPRGGAGNNHVAAEMVPPWELPILNALYTGVQETGKVKIVERDYPDADAEYHRLSNRYGRSEDDGKTFMASIFGNAIEGVGKLEKLIEAAQKREANNGAEEPKRGRPRKATVEKTAPEKEGESQQGVNPLD